MNIDTLLDRWGIIWPIVSSCLFTIRLLLYSFQSVIYLINPIVYTNNPKFARGKKM